MKRHLILAALLTIGAANLNAASPKKTAPEQKGVETINRATAEAHIESLPAMSWKVVKPDGKAAASPVTISFHA